MSGLMKTSMLVLSIFLMLMTPEHLNPFKSPVIDTKGDMKLFFGID
jgi:hypothetical protein